MSSEEGKNRKKIMIALIAVTIGVILVPMVYCLIYLSSVWDVYGEIDKVPVAFVNLDKSVTKDGKEYALGKELENGLKDNKKVGWRFVNHEEAVKGLEGKEYFAIIEIPEDFSQKIAQATDGSFNNPEIIYKGNQGKNFVISQVTSRVAESIKAEINSSIQKEISKTLVDSLYDIKVSIKDAGDGVGTLESGTQKLADGSLELANGLGKAVSGSKQLEEGLRKAADSTSKLQDGTGKLLNGSKELAAGAEKASKGSEQLENGLRTAADSTVKLQEGSKKLLDGSKELAAGAEKASKGSAQLESGLKNAAESVAKLQGGTVKLVDGSSELASGIGSAAEGSKQLVDGLKKITEGQTKIIGGTSTLSEGLNTFKSSLTASNDQVLLLVKGASDLNSNTGLILQGAEKLDTGLNTGITALADGLKQSSGGISQAISAMNEKLESIANSGLSQEDKDKQSAAIMAATISAIKDINDKISTNIEPQLRTTASAAHPLVDNLKQLQQGTQQISEGTGKLAVGLAETQTKAAAGVDKLINGLNEIQAGNSGLLVGLNTAVDKTGELARGLEKLSGGAMSLKDGLKTVNDGNIALKDGLDTAATKTGELSTGLTALGDGINSLKDGLETVNNGNIAVKDGLNNAATKTGELSSGLKSLSSGAASLRDGLETVNNGTVSLKDGLNTAADKSGELSDGLGKLESGAISLKNGMQDANEGVAKLKDGLDSGYNKLNDKLKFDSENMSTFVSEPVNVKDDSINRVDRYGEGLAPYFISLSLWIGVMLMNLVLTLGKTFKLFKSKFMNSFSGRFLVGALLAVIEALILNFVLVKGMGIAPVSVTWFCLTNIFIAIVFFGIMYGVSHGLGVLGAPIMFMVLILQLASSGGTFPIETAPEFFGTIGEILPMTYTVDALRMVISGTNSAILSNDIRTLLITMVACMCGGLIIRSIINIGKKKHSKVLVRNLASEN